MWKKLESKEISKRKIIIIHSSFEKQTLRNIKHVKLSQTETSRKRASVLRIINEQDKFYLYIVCYIHSLIVLCVDHQLFTVLKISLQTTKKQKDFHLHLISFVVFKLKAPREIIHFWRKCGFYSFPRQLKKFLLKSLNKDKIGKIKF